MNLLLRKKQITKSINALYCNIILSNGKKETIFIKDTVRLINNQFTVIQSAENELNSVKKKSINCIKGFISENKSFISLSDIKHFGKITKTSINVDYNIFQNIFTRNIKLA